jgi:hypothetical protein
MADTFVVIDDKDTTKRYDIHKMWFLHLLRDHFVSRFLYFTTAGSAVWQLLKVAPYYISVLLYCSGLGIMDGSTIKC